jgi:hypothetical protein
LVFLFKAWSSNKIKWIVILTLIQKWWFYSKAWIILLEKLRHKRYIFFRLTWLLLMLSYYLILWRCKWKNVRLRQFYSLATFIIRLLILHVFPSNLLGEISNSIILKRSFNYILYFYFTFIFFPRIPQHFA